MVVTFAYRINSAAWALPECFCSGGSCVQRPVLSHNRMVWDPPEGIVRGEILTLGHLPIIVPQRRGGIRLLSSLSPYGKL
jgi:hypothetical protein